MTNKMIDEQFKQAMLLYQTGNYPHARAIFQELVKTCPQKSELWLNLGNTDFQLNVLPQAEKHWEKALEINPLEVNAYLNLGNLYFKQKRYLKAVSYWEQFVALKQEHPNVWLNLGLAMDQLNNPDKALEHYRRYIRLKPASEEAIQLKKRFERAKQISETYLSSAERSLQEGHLKVAKNMFAKAFEAYPGTAQTYKQYAAVLYQLKDFSQALQAYQQSFDLYPDDPAVLINLGVLYEKRSSIVEAVSAYHRALALPDCPDREKAEQRLNRLLNTEAFEQYLDKARHKYEKRAFSEALSMLTCLQELTAYCPSLQNQITDYIQDIRHMTDPVIRAGEKYYTLGEEAETAGRYDQALFYYNQYLSVLPQGDRAGEVLQRKSRLQQQMGHVMKIMLGMDKTLADTAKHLTHENPSEPSAMEP